MEGRGGWRHRRQNQQRLDKGERSLVRVSMELGCGKEEEEKEEGQETKEEVRNWKLLLYSREEAALLDSCQELCYILGYMQ